jgi:hypothetical protein
VVWAIIGSYAFTWYVLDTTRYERELQEGRFQTEADILTRELEEKYVQGLFKKKRVK